MAYDRRRILSKADTPNLYEWRKNINPNEETRKLVHKIKSTKYKRESSVKHEIEDDKNTKAWKPWIVGDFEKRAAILRRRSAPSSSKSGEYQVRSIIPKSLRSKSDFQSSLKSSIPEVLLKRANLEKELKALKSVLKIRDDADFNVDEYTTLDARNKWALQNSVQHKQNVFVDIEQTKKQIYGVESDSAGTNQTSKQIHWVPNLDIQSHIRKRRSRRPKQTLASASTHIEAERMLQEHMCCNISQLGRIVTLHQPPKHPYFIVIKSCAEAANLWN